MHAGVTTVTIQSNKIVSNEVKDNEALLEMKFLANPIQGWERRQQAETQPEGTGSLVEVY